MTRFSGSCLAASWSSAVSVLLVLFLASEGSARELPVAPGEPDSHVRYLNLMEESSQAVFEDVLAAYDQHLQEHPDDVETAVERCRFVQEAFYDEEEDYSPNEDEIQTCLDELEDTFGDAPAVLLLLLEQQWSDEAETFYKQRIKPVEETFDDAKLARVHEHLAVSLQWTDGREKLAARHALEAIHRDPELNLYDIVAEGEAAKGNREEAIRWTLEAVERAEFAWDLGAPVDRLVELEAFEEARIAIDRQRELDPAAVDQQAEARILIHAGDIDAARAVYDRMAESRWHGEEALFERLQMELEHGDAQTVAAAYDRYRDLGAGKDPLLRHRLSILAKFPGLGWRWRDLVGGLALLLTFVGIVLAPGLILVPFHYVALLRARRSSPLPATRTMWDLRHVWFLIAGYLFASLLGAYVFYPREMSEWIQSQTLLTLPDRILVADFWLETVLFVVSLAIVVRVRQLRQLLRSAWPLRRTLSVIVVVVFALRIVAALHVAGWARAGEFETIRALARESGAATLLLTVALLIPILEEIAFRGVLLDGLGKYSRFWVANLLQAMLFMMGHAVWKLWPFYLVFGLTCGVLRKRSGGLLVPIGVHAGNNLIACLILLGQT